MRHLLHLLLLSLLLACSSEKETKTLPPMTGGLNELVLVLDEPLWEGAVGDSIRMVLGGQVPGINWKEPLFDLVQIPKKAFSRIFETHRNLILFQQGTTANVGFQNDYFSEGQLAAVVTYQNPKELSVLMAQYLEVIAYRFQQEEKERVRKEMSLQKGLDAVFEKHDLQLMVPKDFSLALDTTQFSWLEYSPADQEVIMGLFLYELSADVPFSTWELLAKRDSMLQHYVPGEIEGSYMATERLVSPWVKNTKSMGLPTLEIKGIWKMQNAFMGGPFVVHFIQDADKIIVLEAFLFNPGEDKRDRMQQLQLVLESAKSLREEPA